MGWHDPIDHDAELKALHAAVDAFAARMHERCDQCQTDIITSWRDPAAMRPPAGPGPTLNAHYALTASVTKVFHGDYKWALDAAVFCMLIDHAHRDGLI